MQVLEKNMNNICIHIAYDVRTKHVPKTTTQLNAWLSHSHFEPSPMYLSQKLGSLKVKRWDCVGIILCESSSICKYTLICTSWATNSISHLLLQKTSATAQNDREITAHCATLLFYGYYFVITPRELWILRYVYVIFQNLYFWHTFSPF